MDLASGTNDLLRGDTQGFGIQLGILHVEKAGVSLLGERHHCQCTGLICSSAPLPIGFGCVKIGVIQFYDTGKDIILFLSPIALRKQCNKYHALL